MSRYVIVGAGAVGVTLAAQLQAAGREVLLLARGAQLASLRAGTVRYIRPEGTRVLSLPVADGYSALRLADTDVLVLATKTQDADAALAELAWLPVALPGGTTAPAAAVLPLLTTQNGLDAERSALRRFATVYGAVLLVPATYLRAGEVAAAGGPAVGTVYAGRYPDGPADPRLQEIAADLRAAGLTVEVVGDLSRWKAAKLLGAVTFALDALYEPGELRDEAARLLRDEARHVLAAAGYGFADLATGQSGVRPLPGQPRGTSSWQSLTRAGSLESDFLNGEIVLRARLLGLRAPASEAVLARIRLAQRDGTPPRSLGTADLLATLPALRARTSDSVLASVATLRALLDGPGAPALLDVRWALGDPDGRGHYRQAHIPGAVFADLDTQLAAPASAGAGRHPLPAVGDLERAARSWGIGQGQPVVVYDDSGGLAAARAWWLLRWAGVADVRILDGGLGAWTAAGFGTQAGEQAPPPGDVTLSAGHLPVVDADGAARVAGDGVLLDARAGQRYRGETEPVDVRAGHVPGAVSAPATANLGADGTFAAPRELALRYAALGVTPGREVAVYCGSGVTAAHDIAALAVAGIDAALYPGSWSAWSADPDRPTVTGPAPR